MKTLDPFEVDPALERAETIPSSWYFGPEILALEKDLVFGASWQLAAHTGELGEPGAFVTTTIADEPVLVVRGSDGAIRALSNVCRHRAGPVACGSGIRASFQCAYHGWVYSLEGELSSAREMEEARDFEHREMRLPEFEVALWGPLVFVRVREGGPTLGETLRGLDQLTDATEIETFRFARRKEWEIECNWKVYVDNYLEGYHIPIVHPSLNRELDYARYEVETRDWFSIQHAPLRESPERIQKAEDARPVRYFWIWPNLMINVYPDNFSTNLILPLGPDRTLTIFDWYFEEPEAQKPVLDETVKFSDEIQIEDIDICESVQRGLASKTYDRGRYSPKRENGVHHFHRLLTNALQTGRD